MANPSTHALCPDWPYVTLPETLFTKLADAYWLIQLDNTASAYKYLCYVCLDKKRQGGICMWS